MPPASAGLVLCALAALLLWRDVRSLWRRAFWARAMADVTFMPGAAAPAWRIDFMATDGVPVSLHTRNLGLVAKREGPGPVEVLYDPRAPRRGVEIPARLGLRVPVGLGLAGLGLARLLG